MPYRLEPQEPVPDGMKRIAREELDSAAGLLASANAAGRDEAIHEARKSLKKVRALLRLLRPEVDAIFPLENRRLRDTGRRLSALRDAGILIETFDALRERYRKELGRRTLASVRRALVAARKEQERDGVEATLSRAAASLRVSAGRVPRWPLRATGFGSVSPGLEKTFRQARKAMERARKCDKPEDFHEWRKRAKDHWYHVRLLENLATHEARNDEKRLHDLETWLGDDHNLVVLEGYLSAHPELHARPYDVERCLDLIRQRQRELRERSLALGAEIYGEKPRHFVRRLGHVWEAANGAGPAAAAYEPAPVARP